MRELKIDRVTKYYGAFKALDNIELTIKPQEFMVVMGPSGCGKTTLLLVILGALNPEGGHILLDGRPIDGLPIEERNVSYVPQDFGLFPHLTVYGNVAFGLKVRGYPEGETRREVDRLLAAVNLQNLEGRKPKELSAGQRQRVALARALATNPSVLLLDEPLSNIDEATKAEVRENLKAFVAMARITTVCVTHNPEDAFELGDRIAVMFSGRIVQCDSPLNLLQEPLNEAVKRLIAPVYLLWGIRDKK